MRSGLRYILYARKSSEPDDRQVQSLETQVSELQELAARYGYSVVAVLTEAKSAKAPGRSVFNDLIARLEDGKADGILCWKLDRLARNPVDGGRVSWMLQQGIIQSILTPAREYLPSDNVLMLSVELGMANQYILDLSANVKRGVRQKLQQGWYPGVPRQGYMNDTTLPQGQRTIIPDPERFGLVKKMWEILLSGLHSPAQIRKIANEKWGFRVRRQGKRGGTPLASSTIYDMFRDPFYYGSFYWNGVLYKGAHEPMITEEEYWRAQGILGKRGRPRLRKRSWAYTGLIRCGECSGLITAEEHRKLVKKTREIKVYQHYHCARRGKKNAYCEQPSVRVEELEAQIDRFLATMAISEKIAEWCKKYVHELHEQETVDRTLIYDNHEQGYRKAQSQLDQLLDLRLRNLIGDDIYAAKKETLERERERHKVHLDDTDDRAKKWFELAEQTLEFAAQARSRFNRGTNEEKRLILVTIGSNLVLKDKELTITPEKPFLEIQKGLQKREWRVRPDSNRRSPP